MEIYKKKVYYAHPMAFYGSQVEHNDIEMLKKMGYEVINPNHPDNEGEYQKTKDFNVFLNLVGGCDVLAFRSMVGPITSGVGNEIEYAQGLNMPVIELPFLLKNRFLDIHETREYFRPLNIQD